MMDEVPLIVILPITARSILVPEKNVEDDGFLTYLLNSRGPPSSDITLELTLTPSIAFWKMSMLSPISGSVGKFAKLVEA